MAGVNQIFNLADTVASYAKAYGRSVLEIKPPKPNTKITSLAFDSISIRTTPIQNEIKALCENFLEKLYGGKVYPEEVEVLFKNINRNSDNPKLLMKRYQTICENKSNLSYMICECNFDNSDFLIDNMERINSVLTRKILRKIEPNSKKLYNVLGEKELNLLSSCGTDTTKIVKLAKQIIYDATPHNIKFGKNIRTVDSSDVIAIVSGKMSLSYFKTGNSKKFEDTVLELTEIAKPEKGEQYYYKIAEGILQQRPDLVPIVDELKETIKTSSSPILETLTKFFRDKFMSGELPKTITLQTIIPDDNALILPEDTFNIFKNRLL